MQLYEVKGLRPRIHPEVAFIADNVVISGDVEIGAGCTIFDSVVLEGYPMKIRIGNNTNIQSGTMVHGLPDSDTVIGNCVSVGHNSTLHGCTLEDYVTIGMGSIVMGHSILRKGCFLAAGSLVPERKEFPPLSMILGHPAKAIKQLGEETIREAERIALLYAQEGKEFRKVRKKIE
jgi:carbonic anhydrase/acetyltransferase-like protein (isoleucine patch superfamily)